MFVRPKTFNTLSTWYKVLKWVSLHVSNCCKTQKRSSFFTSLACISQEHVAGLLSTGPQVRKKESGFFSLFCYEIYIWLSASHLSFLVSIQFLHLILFLQEYCDV